MCTLKPNWLDLFCVFQDDMPQNAEIAISQIKQCYDQQNFPKQFFLQYIQILKKFEIALEMDEGKKSVVYFFISYTFEEIFFF